MSKKTQRRDERSRKNLPANAGTVIADARRDITIPHFTDVLQPVDETLLTRGQGKGLKIYDEVERDTYAYAALQKRKKTLLARDWEVNPGGEAAIDKEAADFVEQRLKALSFDQISEDLLDATLKGYAVSEIVWKRDGATIVPARVISHDQRRFVFDLDWQPRLLTFKNMMKGEDLPPRKFIIHRHGVKGNNPNGLGLGSRLFWAVLFKREGVAFWLHFLDKFAAPTVVGKSPYGTLSSQQRELLDTLASIVTRSAITVPIGTEVSFLEASRSGSVSYLEWCQYWDKQISICVTGETLTSDIGNAGSRAASETHQEILEMLVDGDGDMLSATLRDQLLTWMVEYNFPGAAVPEVWRIRPDNVKEAAEARSATAEADTAHNAAVKEIVKTAAVFGDDKAARDYIMSFEMVSCLADETVDRLVKARHAFASTAQPAGPPDDARPDPDKKKVQTPIEALFADADEEDERPLLVRRAQAASAGPIGRRIDQVRRAIEASGSLEEARAALDALAAEAPLELTALFGDVLELALLLGREAVWLEMDEDAPRFAEPDVWNQEFREQIEFLRQKRPEPTRDWTDLMHGAHDRGFAIAGAADTAMLADFQEAIASALESGLGLDGFLKDFDRIVAKYGWEYRGDRAWRAHVIWDTNINTAYMAARLKQMTHPDVVRMRPFWQYRHGERRTPRSPRPHHVAWHELVLMWNDPWWKTHFPPNGWFCTCGVRTLGRRDLARLGKTGPDTAPEPAFEAIRHPETGQLIEFPQGIDFGFDYMPGERWLAVEVVA